MSSVPEVQNGWVKLFVFGYIVNVSEEIIHALYADFSCTIFLLVTLNHGLFNLSAISDNLSVNWKSFNCEGSRTIPSFQKTKQQPVWSSLIFRRSSKAFTSLTLFYSTPPLILCHILRTLHEFECHLKVTNASLKVKLLLIMWSLACTDNS